MNNFLKYLLKSLPEQTLSALSYLQEGLRPNVHILQATMSFKC
jgi:hypothetical protein